MTYVDRKDWRYADPSVRVVVLTGEGNAFCAGLDLSVLTGSADPQTDPRRAKAQAKGLAHAGRTAPGARPSQR